MGLNVGYLTSDKTLNGDECYTPFYAVDPLLKYISKEMIIWLPFDEEWSAFYQIFIENGYKVIRSSLSDKKDFFKYEPIEHYDVIISNPPFSKKDDVLQRLYNLKKPFAILLPMNSLQGKKRYEYFKKGIQLLSFDSRIDYHTNGDFKEYTKGTPYASAYFCKDLLPKDLIIEKLEKYNRDLLEHV